MIHFTDDDVFAYLTPLNPTHNGSRTHWICDCPTCNKPQHLYIQRKTEKTNTRGENVSFHWQCKKCLAVGRIEQLLRKIGVNLQFVKTHSALFEQPLVSKINQELCSIAELPNHQLPDHFIEVEFHPYLESRNWEDWMYDIFRPHASSVFQDYVFFPISFNCEIKAHIGRSIYDKSTIERINEYNKQNGLPKYLRYKNSDHSFGKMLGNYDHCYKQPLQKIVVVEGLFDCASVQKYIKQHSLHTGCVYTFGKGIGEDQLRLLLQLPGDELIFFIDPDALKEVQQIADKLWMRGRTITTCWSGDGRDPGDLNDNEIKLVVDRREHFVDFYRNNRTRKPLFV